MSTALPPETISDVLCRLPVKSLLRFRCTSKPFCSLIDSPDFAKLHLHQTDSNSKQSLVLCNRNCPLFSVDLPWLERALEIDHPLKTLKANTKVIDSCNGLLCLINSDLESMIVLWNMSTRKHHAIFPGRADITSHQVAYGFGYDSVHGDYKVVRIVRFHNTLESEVMVYSLKSNSWKNLLCHFPYDFLHMRSVGMLAEGALHWPVFGGRIAAFDLPTEEFRELSPPPEPLRGDPFELWWLVFEGHLCVNCNGIAKGAEIWMLKHNEGVGESSWTKWLSVSDPQLTYPHSIVPIAYLSNGNELLLLQDKVRFLSYDLKTNKVKNVVTIRGTPSSFYAVTYVESLVKPLPMVNATLGKHKSKKNAAKRDDFLSKGFKLV